MFRLPKRCTAHPYCALRSQHLLSQMHSLSIIPAFHAGAFSTKSTFIKISLPLHLPNPPQVKDQGRTKEEPRNTERTPNHQKVLFVKIRSLPLPVLLLPVIWQISSASPTYGLALRFRPQIFSVPFINPIARRCPVSRVPIPSRHMSCARR